MLEQVIADIPHPPHFKTEVAGGQTFADALAKLLQPYEIAGKRPPPIFAFIDPFGWTGAPFSAVRQILTYPSCEILITFMYEEINRFIGLPQQEANFDKFFDTRDWRSCVELKDPNARNHCLHDIYQQQLREAGAKYVRSFKMSNDRDNTDYYLFYATKRIEGLKKMKEAMWKVDTSGDFSFSDATNPDQLVLIAREPQLDLLAREISDRFKGSETTVGAVEEFVLAETAFRETHYKGILRGMERIEHSMEPIDALPHRRPGTFSDPGLKLYFK